MKMITSIQLSGKNKNPNHKWQVSLVTKKRCGIHKKEGGDWVCLSSLKLAASAAMEAFSVIF